jgi:hypothetical protein
LKYKQDGVLDKDRTMGNVQKHNICNNDSKPDRVVIKSIPITTPPKAIQDELLVLRLAVQNAIPVTAGETERLCPCTI